MTTTTPTITLSSVLKNLLETHKLSGIRLANAIDLPPQTVNRLISGQVTDPKSSTLQSIANYFDLTLDQLLGKMPLTQLAVPVQPRQAEAIPRILLSTNTRDGDSPHSIFYWPIPRGKQSAYLAILVDTDRYSPAVQQDATLILNTDCQPQHNDLVAIQIQNSILLKKYVVEGPEAYFYPLHAGQNICNASELVYNRVGVVVEAVIRYKSETNS